jgi:hypothetical protein
MEEKIILNTLVEIFSCKDKLNKSSEIEDDKKLGFQLSYFLTEQMGKSTEFDSQKIWIDNVEWESLEFISDNEIQGNGKLWWGNRADFDKMFSEDFVGEFRVEQLATELEFKYTCKYKISDSTYCIENL